MKKSEVTKGRRYGGIFLLAVLVVSIHAAQAQNLVAWGSNSQKQTNIPPDLSGTVVSVATGGFHSLALKADGTVIAWGKNFNKQTNVPADIGNVIAVAAGGNHSLVLRSNGTVVAWGEQLGRPDQCTDGSNQRGGDFCRSLA